MDIENMKRYQVKYYQEHKEDKIAYTRAYYRNKTLKRKYGITSQEYDSKLNEQQGKCAICGKFPTVRSLHVDHDHTTGEIRGLLCFFCNTRLAWYEEHKDKVIKYLK